MNAKGAALAFSARVEILAINPNVIVPGKSIAALLILLAEIGNGACILS